MTFIPISMKSGSVIGQTFIDQWASIFGVPFAIHTDNALEFRFGLQRELANKFNIQQSFCGIYAGHQNARVERSHRFLGDQLKR